MRTVYLDYAATAPVLDVAARAAAEAMAEFGNPSSQYPLGREAGRRLEADRACVAAALGCAPEEVYFTSGGTEGDNWALRWALQRRRGHIITTAIEHPAVLEPLKELQQRGFDVTRLPVGPDGRISAADFRAALREDTVLVSIMLVNNELGSVQPVGECFRAAKAFRRDIFCHTDVVQGFLKVPFTVGSLGADAVSVSGHKLGAPKGIGAFYLKKDVRLKAMLLGGGQERGLRSGTEPTVLAHALAAAVEYGSAHRESEARRLDELRSYATARLTEAVPGLEVLCRGEAPHVLALTLPGYKSEVVVRMLGDMGICLSSGSACHKGRPSHVYAALGLNKARLDGALRVSFGYGSTREDVDALTEGLKTVRETLFPTLS